MFWIPAHGSGAASMDVGRGRERVESKIQNTNTQIHKYTDTQIQHMTKCQKDQTCGIFLKRGLFKDIKKFIPMCRTHKYKITNTKYTNTAYDKVLERPNM